MRRLLHLTLVCAVLALAVPAAALAADGHHHHATTTTATTSRSAKTGKAKIKTAKGTKSAHSSTTAHASTAHHAPAPAAAGGKATVAEATKVLNDCQNHGQLTHVYSRAVLEKAQSMMSSGTSQYSNCSSVISAALLHTVKSGGSGGSGGSGTVIIIVIAVVLIALAALLGALALRRRRGPGGPAKAT